MVTIAMRTWFSELTGNYRATIPEPVRRLLQLKADDRIAFDIKGDKVSIRKARTGDTQFARGLEGAMTDWLSEADEKAYRDVRRLLEMAETT